MIIPDLDFGQNDNVLYLYFLHNVINLLMMSLRIDLMEMHGCTCCNRILIPHLGAYLVYHSVLVDLPRNDKLHIPMT